MELNLPILHLLEHSKNILIAGAGGGFDIFAGLPIYFTLKDMGKTVHLANYSFTHLNIVGEYCNTKSLTKEFLEGATADIPDELQLGYYPEGYLSQWFKRERGEDVTVWMFDRTGPKMLKVLYQQLIDHLNIDALILIDGGIDSLMRGDEAGAGTLLEDTITMSAIESLDIPIKVLGCLGFGAELEVCHYNALDNMSRMIKAGAFYGSCALVKQMHVYRDYEQACRYVWERPSHKKSQINMRVVSATEGEFGNHHRYTDYEPLPVFVSPLMSLYWFYDAQSVVKNSYLAEAIRDELTIEDAYEKCMQLRTTLQSKARDYHPIPY
jgi:hypothetical protein